MSFHGQKILPAIRSMKDFEKMLSMNYEYGVFLDLHIGMVKSVMDLARQNEKNMFVHLDLISGLAGDEHGVEFIARYAKPFGIISTKGSALVKAKQKGLIATQRAFILDSNALSRSVKLAGKANPDFIEVLPGVAPKIIEAIRRETGKPIFAGGLIETKEEVTAALEAGASAVTTSDVALWKEFEGK
ncbi:glycerol-3-phosphate responsive antiterminator [Domibacillus epiphyticus]|uniref:Glycerol uptake operon antiterminator regulatory protein n=1 Tax=Domibacillus epiphyticus TaxID=1714355 RepID=A0A1V2ACF2_9BACI|nr:glycerol-3-phosphate responsive antiterminator [Domibacillus epiphyticus]OMP68675.1 glycerol-3-phosphate responsive antiterminator GlpP [Domibacillus epiphyticus]